MILSLFFAFLIVIGLVIIGAAFLTAIQWYSLRIVDRQDFNTLIRPEMNWQAIFDLVLIEFIIFPVAILIYSILVGGTNSGSMIDVAMLALSGLALVSMVDNLIICRKYAGSIFWPTVIGWLDNDETAFYAGYNLRVLFKPGHKLCYHYKVNSRLYTGRVIDVHGYRRKPRYHDEEGRVTVFYNPVDPTDAMLEPGVNWASSTVSLALAITCLSLPVVFWILRNA